MTTIPPEPSPTSHEAAANALIKEIRELIETRIPGFALAAKGRRLKINTTASLSDGFLEAAAAACAAHHELSVVGQITADEIRDSISRSRVLATVAEELSILSRGVADTAAEARNEVGKKARRIYHYASTLNEEEDRELLFPHRAAMKRTLNRGRTSASAKRGSATKAAVAAKVVPAPTTPIAPANTPKKEGSSS
jgi:hypothetical protein